MVIAGILDTQPIKGLTGSARRRNKKGSNMFTELLEFIAVAWCVPFCVDFMPGFDWADLEFEYEI